MESSDKPPKYYSDVIHIDKWIAYIWKRSLDLASHIPQALKIRVLTQVPDFGDSELRTDDPYPKCVFIRIEPIVVVAIPVSDIERIDKWMLEHVIPDLSLEVFRKTNKQRIRQVRKRFFTRTIAKFHDEPDAALLLTAPPMCIRPVDLYYQPADETSV